MSSKPPSHGPISGGTKAASGRGARNICDKPRLDQPPHRPDAPHRFAGFRPIDANFIYTPNQFFDLCLPRHSRGCVRLIGYLLRRTLGWLGPDGRPIEQKISVTWRQLIVEAGISRGAIRAAVEEAVAARYVRVVRQGRAKAAGQSAATARYELRWDDSGEWRGTPGEFAGFFTGEGRRSPIPDTYFDEVVRHEPLAVARVVGIVLRQTIGYQNQFGGRRQQAALSFSELQRRCGIADRKTLSKAVREALDIGYIRLAREGIFDPDAGRTSAAAEYGVRWHLADGDGPIGSKSPPVPLGPSVQNSYRPAADDRSKNPTGRSVQNPHRNQSNNPTGNGSEAPPVASKEGKTLSKNTSKQQQQRRGRPAALRGSSADSPAVAAGLLEEAGFDAAAVEELSARADPEVIRRQIEWLPRRSVARNRLGLLRRAILEDWSEPKAEGATEADAPPAHFASAFYVGLAGIGADEAGASVAEPTAADLRSAARLCGALPSSGNDGTAYERATRLGHAFGARVRHERQSTAGGTPPPSLASATRTHGDRFVRDVRARQRAEAERQLVARREAHRDRFAGTYGEYLLACERELREGRPEDWAHFDRWRQRQRERFAEAPARTRDALLAHWNSDEQRLDDMVAFFRDEVLDFWGWDRTHNPQGFGAAGDGVEDD